MLSECCGAPPKHSVEDGIGICSQCGEWAEFRDEDDVADEDEEDDDE